MGNLGKCVIFGNKESWESTRIKLSSYYEILLCCENDPIDDVIYYFKQGAIIVVSHQTRYRQMAVRLKRYGISEVYVMNDGFSYKYSEGEMLPFSLLPVIEPFKKKSKDSFAILYVQYYPNIRTSRIASVIKDLECEVAIAYYKETHQKGTIEVFGGNQYCFSTYKELIDLVNNSEFDVVQVANRSFATLLVHTNKKILLDVQDMFSLYKNLHSTELSDEYIENSFCDGAIYTHCRVRDIAVEKYEIDASRTHIVENLPLESSLITERKEKLSKKDGEIHVVYEGDISFFDSRERDFYDYWRKLAEIGVHVHIYSALIRYPKIIQLIEENTYVHYEGNLSSADLALEMTKYDCGWMMFNNEEGIGNIHLNYCSTNKLYEYLNAGLPVIIGDSKCHRGFIDKYNCGGELNFECDLISQLKKIASMKISVNFIEKNGLTMDRQAIDILNFYKFIIAGKE